MAHNQEPERVELRGSSETNKEVEGIALAIGNQRGTAFTLHLKLELRFQSNKIRHFVASQIATSNAVTLDRVAVGNISDRLLNSC